MLMQLYKKTENNEQIKKFYKKSKENAIEILEIKSEKKIII